MFLLRIAYSLYFYPLVLLGTLLGLFFLVVTYPFFRSHAKIFQTVAHLWARYVMMISFIRMEVHGCDNIPRDQPVIFAANHQGAADILIILAYIPIPFRFVIKRELFSLPIFGWILRNCGYFRVDREAVLSVYKLVQTFTETLQAGNSILIFPEGTRSRTGQLGPFKRGSLLAALKGQVPVIPVAISGSYNVLPRGARLIFPCPIKLSFGKMVKITSEHEYDKRLEKIRNVILQML